MTTPNECESKKTREFIWDRPAIDRAAKEAVRRALLRHKLLGESIVVWEDGKCVWVAPEDIQVPEADDAFAPVNGDEPRKQAG